MRSPEDAISLNPGFCLLSFRLRVIAERLAARVRYEHSRHRSWLHRHQPGRGCFLPGAHYPQGRVTRIASIAQGGTGRVQTQAFPQSSSPLLLSARSRRSEMRVFTFRQHAQDSCHVHGFVSANAQRSSHLHGEGLFRRSGWPPGDKTSRVFATRRVANKGTLAGGLQKAAIYPSGVGEVR